MPAYLKPVLGAHAVPLLRSVVGLYGVLALANLAAWALAILLFRDRPVLLGTALLAYGFGLRHAVDADHIAAIDNVTRKLVQNGGRPIAVGCFFAIGHSMVVILACAGVAATAARLSTSFGQLQLVGSVVGTAVSALFLFAIAGANLLVLKSVWRSFRRVRQGASVTEEDLDAMLSRNGLLARLFRPLFQLVSRSWHMLPIGFLFGLGFDTATEVALLGISATQAAKGVSVWAIMVFPALFAAGMSLIDTTDGILMLGAYSWATITPARKLAYNLTITAASVFVAVVVGGIEALGLLGDRFQLQGPFWEGVSALNGQFGLIGLWIIVLLTVTWIGSLLIYRYRKLATLR